MLYGIISTTSNKKFCGPTRDAKAASNKKRLTLI